LWNVIDDQVNLLVVECNQACNFLAQSAGCAYKGFARYWSLTVGEIKRENIAWSYATPLL